MSPVALGPGPKSREETLTLSVSAITLGESPSPQHVGLVRFREWPPIEAAEILKCHRSSDHKTSNRGDMKGLGRIQRRIRLALVGYPHREFTTAELAEWAYPMLEGSIERKHRWAIDRAAGRVGRRVRRDRPGGVIWRGGLF